MKSIQFKWDIGRADNWDQAMIMARDGWELVSVCLKNGMLGADSIFYFKRPNNETK